MAAPQKRGLDYYPRDVGLLKDRKFIKAKIKYGYLSIVVYDALLEMIYADKGYYIDYSTDSEREAVVWDILDSVRGKYQVDAETVYDVIEMLVGCRLFSHDHFKQGIITSKRIQVTYYKCTVERKNVEVDEKIWLLNIEEMKALSKNSAILSNLINQPINEINQSINKDNGTINLQSKVKESKVKESKGEREHTPTLTEIKNYCIEKGYSNYNYEKFYNYYSSNGWTIKGSVPLVNWQAKLDSWYKEDIEKIKGEQGNKSITSPKGIFNGYKQKAYSEEVLEEILRRKNGNV